MNSLYGVGSLDVRGAVALRLSPDAMVLDICFGPEAPSMAPSLLLGLVQMELTALGLKLSLDPAALGTLLQAGTSGTWTPLLEANGPAAPTDGRLELLVPVAVVAAHQGIQGQRHAVSAGTALARRLPGTPARPSFDLLGRGILSRQPYEARLPRGPNTVVSDDGTLLLAACDGEVRLRNLLIEVTPVHLHKGDVPAGTTLVLRRLPVFVMGSVLGNARLEADSEVYIRGDVIEAHVFSHQSSIIVQGSVVGSSDSPCWLQAGGSISCGATRHALLMAGTDVRLLAQARQSTLRAKGNVYLPRSMQESLEEVELHVDGGLLPILDPETLVTDIPRERQHVRVSSQLRASLAMHSISTLIFRPCALLDLSVSGARCALQARDVDPQPGSIVQLKILLPGCRDQVFSIGRIARRTTGGIVAISFLQMTQRDQDRLITYCLQLVLKRPNRQLAGRERRGDEGDGVAL
jgi:hypothetical protein